MTASTPSHTLPVTPLAASFGNAPLAACRGALSAQRLDAPQREWSALTTGAAAHDLGWMRRIAVRGDDRFRWLSGMVTNTVNDLPANAGAWNLVLNAQGRIQGELYVWREGRGQPSDALELEIAADQYEKLLAHFERFIIMDDVELLALPEESALGLTGPRASQVLEKMGLPLPVVLTSLRTVWNGLPLLLRRGYGLLAEHYELWVESGAIPALWAALLAAGATPVGVEGLEALRIAEAVPAYGIDMVERDLPQETAQMRALHFTKGCYLGQEIVERIRSRGSVHRHLRQLELDGPLPAPGAELHFTNAAGSEAVAGTITSAVELPGGRRLALAMIRAEAELRAQPFSYTAEEAAGSATVLKAPPALSAGL
jgi:folate-binding protein YgfZ